VVVSTLAGWRIKSRGGAESSTCTDGRGFDIDPRYDHTHGEETNDA